MIFVSKQNMSNQRLRQEWDKLLTEQSASGLSKKTFCEQRGLNPATFYYWQRRLRQPLEESTLGFQQVLVQQEHELTVCLSGVELVLRSPSVSTLGEVIKALVGA